MVAAVGIKSMLSFGTAVWSPSFFERQFGWGPGTPGLSLGLLALIASPIGLVFGGWLADRLVKAGRDDAHMRIVLWASWGVVPFAILFPLMPTPGLALVMLGALALLRLDRRRARPMRRSRRSRRPGCGAR